MNGRRPLQGSPYQDSYDDAYGGGSYQVRGAAYGAGEAPQGAGGAVPAQADAYSYDRDEALQRYQSGVSGKRKRGKVLKVVGIVLAVLLAGVLVYLLWPGSITRSPSYVLLLGSDESIERNNDTSETSLGGVYRTDTMILTRLDPAAKKATLVSLPRDTQVELPGYGTQKLNAAFVFGGLPLCKSTVEQLAGVPISHYVMVDMDGLSNLVDSLGGIEVDVPITIDDPDAGGYLDAGRQVLNGEQALILCRSRNAFEEEFGNGDGYRAANQRMVIQAIVSKALSSDPVTLATSLPAILGMISTDISLGDLVRLVQAYAGMDTARDLYTGVMPTISSYEDDLWYEIVIPDEWAEMMKRVDAGLPPTEGDQMGVFADAGSGSGAGQVPSSTGSIAVRNGSGIAGVASAVTERLEQAGFSVVDVGNADSFDYASTIVVCDDPALADTAQAIAHALGTGSAMVNDGTYAFDTDFLVVIGQDYY